MHANYTQDDDIPAYEITVDALGTKVWVNGSDGSSIGRFNKARGIDVHTTATAQMAGEGECLYCTHKPAGEPEWNRFREEMKKHYNIDIPSDLLSFSDEGNGPKKVSKCRPK